jgi:hypothetical protein
MDFCSKCLQEGHKSGDAVCSYRPAHYCSQCGMEGHNKRNANCGINVNSRWFRSWMDEIENCLDLARRHSLIYECIRECQTYVEESNRHYEECKRKEIFYKKFHNESIEKHNFMKLFGNEEDIRISYEMEASRLHMYKGYNQSFISARKFRDDSKKYLDLIMEYDRIVTDMVPFTRPKLTTEYLKEIKLAIRKPSGSETSLDCPVCYDTLLVADALYTNCDHSYCVECVKQLATSIKNKTIKPACPCCRDTITQIYSRNVDNLHNLKTHFTSL